MFYKFTSPLLPLTLAMLATNSWSHGDNAPNIQEEVIVSASPLAKSASENPHPVSVLSGDQLLQQASATLGETLQGQPGISIASFGPGVGSPIIRGMGANRVKVMQDNLDTLDAANASADHANTVEPLLADSIEILRGPQTLRFGNGAIGGVVNVIDSRIPREQTDKTKAALETRHNSVNDETSTVIRVDGSAGNVGWHADGLYRDSNDTRIDGSAERFPDEHSTTGSISNTDSMARGGTLGGSWFFDTGFIGLSVNQTESDYGIPPGAHIHHDEDDSEEEEAEQIRIHMRQTRYDLKSEIDSPITGIDQAKLRVGYVDYAHTEIENGQSGTKFTSQALEGRLELIHTPLDQWQGAVGLQWLDRDFAAIGDEAFIPRSDISNLGIFIIEERTFGPWLVELGARTEQQQIDPETGATAKHQTTSISAASQYHINEQHSLLFSVNRAQRAPSIEELYSNGPHLATLSIDQGNQDLDEETSVNWEMGYRYTGKNQFTASFYKADINGFISKQNTGIEDADEELPIYQYSQSDATFTGAELEAKLVLSERWQLDLLADTVRAEFDQGGDIPRITPDRLGGELHYIAPTWESGVRLTHAFTQSRAGEFETETDSYNRLDAHITWHLQTATVFIRGTNLLNEEIRQATSYLRDIAPEAGRGITVGLRLTY